MSPETAQILTAALTALGAFGGSYLLSNARLAKLEARVDLSFEKIGKCLDKVEHKMKVLLESTSGLCERVSALEAKTAHWRRTLP